jgi:hypothetical protein
MPLPFLRVVVSRMVAEGSAEYDPPVKGKTPPTGAFIYWKRPEEWATTIYNWVSNLPSVSPVRVGTASWPLVLTE